MSLVHAIRRRETSGRIAGPAALLRVVVPPSPPDSGPPVAPTPREPARLTFAGDFVWIYRLRNCGFVHPWECRAPADDGSRVTVAMMPYVEGALRPVPMLMHETALHELARRASARQVGRAVARGWVYAVEIPTSLTAIDVECLLATALRTMKRVEIHGSVLTTVCNPGGGRSAGVSPLELALTWGRDGEGRSKIHALLGGRRPSAIELWAARDDPEAARTLLEMGADANEEGTEPEPAWWGFGTHGAPWTILAQALHTRSQAATDDEVGRIDAFVGVLEEFGARFHVGWAQLLACAR